MPVQRPHLPAGCQRRRKSLKDKKDERYVKLGITGCAIALFALISYFVLSNVKGIRDALHALGVILRPFVYGAVIAYLVVPLCRRLQR